MEQTLICGLIQDESWQQIKQVFELDAQNFDGYVEYAKFKPNPVLQGLISNNPLDIMWIYYQDQQYDELIEKLACILQHWGGISCDVEDDEYSFGAWDSAYLYQPNMFKKTKSGWTIKKEPIGIGSWNDFLSSLSD